MNLIFRRNFIISTFVIAMLYLVIAIYIMNFSLVKSTLLGSFKIDYKIKLLISLLGGVWTAMSGFGLAMSILISLLTGANFTLIFQRFMQIRSFGKLHFFAGAGSLMGFIGSGCVVCGLPILALFGLSGSIIYLPFRGAEISVISAILLIVSFYLIIKSEMQNKVCSVN